MTDYPDPLLYGPTEYVTEPKETPMTPAQKAAAQAILDHIAPGQEHTSPLQNLDTYADMAKHIVDYVTPEIFDAVAELVAHKFPEEFTKEFMVEQLRQSARFRRAQLADEERRLYDAMFGQADAAEGVSQ